MRKLYYKINKINGPVIELKAKNIQFGELAKIFLSNGEQTYGQVIKIDNDFVSLQVFSGSKGISTDDKLCFLGHQARLGFHKENLKGRIFNGTGIAIDGRAKINDIEQIEINGPLFNPINRLVPSNMIHTGIPMIDMFNTLVESQKIPIFSIAGEPYNELLARIGLQAEVDVIIFGGMGLKYNDYLFFKKEFKENKEKIIMFVNTASDPIVECLMVPDMCLAAAEKYAFLGDKVLVLLTDMTAFANSLKEVSIAMEQIPANRGYPGDLYSQLALRYERAVDIDGFGSITILSVTTIPGEDITHPIPDNTGYITEGQFYLKNRVIDPFISLSRLKQLVNRKTREDHALLVNVMIQLYDQCHKVRQQQSMGFNVSLFDKKLLNYGTDFESQMMNLDIKINLENQLNLGWLLLKKHFSKDQIQMPKRIVKKYWNINVDRSDDK